MGSGRKGHVRNTEDISGQKFERLTALKPVGSKYRIFYACQANRGQVQSLEVGGLRAP